MKEHEAKKGPKTFFRLQAQPDRDLVNPGEAENCQAADKVAEGQELFRGEVAVGELRAEENGRDRCQGEGVHDPTLFRIRETHGSQVGEDQGSQAPQMANSRNIITDNLMRTGAIHGGAPED